MTSPPQKKRRKSDQESISSGSEGSKILQKRTDEHVQFASHSFLQLFQEDSKQDSVVSEGTADICNPITSPVSMNRCTSDFYDKDEDSLQMRVQRHLQDSAIAERTHSQDGNSRFSALYEEDDCCTIDVNLQYPLEAATQNTHLVGPKDQSTLRIRLSSLEVGENLLERVQKELQHIESELDQSDVMTRREKQDLENLVRDDYKQDHVLIQNDDFYQDSQQSECLSEQHSEMSLPDNSSLITDNIDKIEHFAEQQGTKLQCGSFEVEDHVLPRFRFEGIPIPTGGEVCDESQEVICLDHEGAPLDFSEQLRSSSSNCQLSLSSSERSFKTSSSSSIQDSQIAESDIEAYSVLEALEDSDIENNVVPDFSPINSAMELALAGNNVKLYDGSSLSINEGILSVMDLWISNKDSKSGLDRILKTMSKLLPKPNNLPSSSHNVLSFIEGLAPDLSVTKHFLCKSCGIYLESVDPCYICVKDSEDEESDEANTKSETGHFFMFDIESIVRYWFEERNSATLMLESRQNNFDDGSRSDIQDGTVFKSLQEGSSLYDVHLILGIDGVTIRKGTCKECWLVMAVPVEVPIHLRKSFTTVVGIWYDKVKPKNMNAFLRPLCEKINKINGNKGFSWKHPDTKQTHKSQIEVPLIVADAPARAKVQNLMSHGAINGCNICEISSVRCAPIPKKKTRRVFKYKRNVTLRNKRSMELQAEEATTTGRPKKGVKGYSILSSMPNFDISSCCIPEYMHSVLLGVVKHMIKLWIKKPGAFSLKNRISAIDDILSNIQHPDFVHRIGRTFSHLSSWKASDYGYFLLYEALPVLEQFLPEQFYQHLILLVRSIYQLLKRTVSDTDINEADLLLRLFACKFERLYGDRSLTYNIHQMCHLALCVERFGPLHCNSAFPFEDMNGTIAKTTHGTNLVSEEIVNNLRIYQGVQRLEQISKGLDSNCSHIDFCTGVVLGRSREIEVSPEEGTLLGSSSLQVYSRARIGYDVYTSEVHKKLKTANYYVKRGGVMK